jgi:IS1 family transposase
VRSKKENKIGVWTAVDRNRMRFVAVEVEKGNSDALKILLKKIKIGKVKIICADGNYSYEDELLKTVIDGERIRKIHHVISKSETCLAENYNSVLRYYLARLHRKIKRYSKSIKMLRLSILPLLHHWESTCLL